MLPKALQLFQLDGLNYQEGAKQQNRDPQRDENRRLEQTNDGVVYVGVNALMRIWLFAYSDPTPHSFPNSFSVTGDLFLFFTLGPASSESWWSCCSRLTSRSVVCVEVKKVMKLNLDLFPHPGSSIKWSFECFHNSSSLSGSSVSGWLSACWCESIFIIWPIWSQFLHFCWSFLDRKSVV